MIALYGLCAHIEVRWDKQPMRHLIHWKFSYYLGNGFSSDCKMMHYVGLPQVRRGRFNTCSIHSRLNWMSTRSETSVSEMWRICIRMCYYIHQFWVVGFRCTGSKLIFKIFSTSFFISIHLLITAHQSKGTNNASYAFLGIITCWLHMVTPIKSRLVAARNTWWQITRLQAANGLGNSWWH